MNANTNPNAYNAYANTEYNDNTNNTKMQTSMPMGSPMGSDGQGWISLPMGSPLQSEVNMLQSENDHLKVNGEMFYNELVWTE